VENGRVGVGGYGWVWLRGSGLVVDDTKKLLKKVLNGGDVVRRRNL